MAKQGKSLGSKVGLKVSEPSKLTEYEKQRNLTIEKNALKFKELGMEKLANDLLAKVKSLQHKDKKKHKIIELTDQDYVPDEDQFDDDDDSEQEFFEVPSTEIEETNELVETLTKSISKKELASAKKKKKPLCPSMEMDDFIKLQQQKDPSETQQVDVEIQNLETRLRSKRKQTAIIQSENQTDVSVIDNQVVVPLEKQGPKKKTRGPTNMFEVHARKWEDRVAIYCNDKGQPVGPSKAKDELSLFLGTIARDHNWAPLIYTDWHKVPNKDKIWEYVQSKYILPTIAKDWVLTTVDWCWRGWKCRLKKLHYYSYSNNSDRWTFRPLNVPEAHFKTLLAYWNTQATKKTSLQNFENRSQQDNMHTTGPKGFAGIHQEMLEMDGEAPSKLKMFERTRRRKEGRTYKTSADDTQKKIEAMRRLEASQVDVSDDSKKDPFDEVMKEDHNGYVRLIGKGVSRKKLKASGASNSLVFPTEVMETIKAGVQKDMLAEKEELDKEKRAHAAKVAEFTEMQKNYEAEKESLAHEVVSLVLAQLRGKKDLNLTPDLIAKAVVSTIDGGAET